MLTVMRAEIDELLRPGRAASRDTLLALVGRHALDNEIKRKRLIAVFPRAYARSWDADDELVRLCAALESVGGEVALSHLTALSRCGLPVPDGHPLHVTAYQPRHPRGVPGQLVVHRTLLPLAAREVDGLPTVRPETALVTSWPLLTGSDQRAPVIEATRRRLVSPTILSRTAEAMYWIRGRRALCDLVGQLLAGCESELELWGYLCVFDVPGLDHAVRQRVVRVGEQVFRLDMAYERERVGVELDGRAYHAATAQWERDIATST